MSLSLIWASSHLLALSAYPPTQASSLQASVYVAFQPTRFTKPAESPQLLVGSYPTFSPLPQDSIDALWRFPSLRHCLSSGPPGASCLPVRKRGALVALIYQGGKSGQHREPYFPKGKAHSTECDRQCHRDSNRRWPSGTGKGEKVR